MRDANGVSTVIVDPQDPNVMYVADSKELYQSIDAGETWRGAMGFGVCNIGIDPQNSATLYAGTEHGVFKSTDRGGSWSWVRELGSGPMDVVFDPHDSRTISTELSPSFSFSPLGSRTSCEKTKAQESAP